MCHYMNAWQLHYRKVFPYFFFISREKNLILNTHSNSCNSVRFSSKFTKKKFVHLFMISEYYFGFFSLGGVAFQYSAEKHQIAQYK